MLYVVVGYVAGRIIATVTICVASVAGHFMMYKYRWTSAGQLCSKSTSQRRHSEDAPTGWNSIDADGIRI